LLLALKLIKTVDKKKDLQHRVKYSPLAFALSSEFVLLSSDYGQLSLRPYPLQAHIQLYKLCHSG
jgi:hypothetical protein